MPFSCWLAAMPITRSVTGAVAGLDLYEVADLRVGDARQVALDDGDAGAQSFLGRRVPASVGDPVTEHRLLTDGPDVPVLAGEPDLRVEHRLDRGDPGRRSDQLLRARVAPDHELDVLAVVAPLGVCRLRDARGEGEDGQQVADGERDHYCSGDAAAPAPADVAEPDLQCPRQEADAPQKDVAGVLAPDRGAGRLECVAQRQTHGPPDRRQRGERGREQADEHAEGEDRRVDVEADVDCEEGRAEVADEQVREHDAEDHSDDGPERTEQQGRFQVDDGDLPASAADRLHRSDLGRLLGDERCHRVGDQHERRQQRENRDHVEELGERVEVGLAGPVACSAHLRQPREAVESRDARERATDGRRRLGDRGRARVGEAEGERLVAGDAAQQGDRLGRRVEDDDVAVGHVLAAARLRPTPLTRRGTVMPLAAITCTVSPEPTSSSPWFAFWRSVSTSFARGAAPEVT